MDSNQVSTLMKMIEIVVVGEVNDSYEHFVFHSRAQKEGGSDEELITALRGTDQDMWTLRVWQYDRQIAEIPADIWEKLLQERRLTLDKCLDMCRDVDIANKLAREVGDVAKTEMNAVSDHQICYGYRKMGVTGHKTGSATAYGH